jgi:hypothetical protein
MLFSNLQGPTYIFNLKKKKLKKNCQGIYDVQDLDYKLGFCKSKVRVCKFSTNFSTVFLLAEASYVQEAKNKTLQLFSSIQVKLKKAPKKVKAVITYQGCEKALLQYMRFKDSCNSSSFFFKDFYRILCDPHYLLYVYSYVSQLIKPLEKLENLTLASILKIATELKSQIYNVKPIRRIRISKGSKSFLLGIANSKDKLVQYAVYHLLDPYLDRFFLKNSHGFRKKKSTHTCLVEMAKE